MSPTKDRQRAAARAKLEREMAARAESVKRRRQLQIGIASGVAVLLVIVGTVWIIVSSTGDKKGSPATTQPSASAAPTTCQWFPVATPSASPAPKPDPNVKDVGQPPTTPVADGQTMALTLKEGTVEIKLDPDAPCAATSFTYLAGKKFFDNTKCHRLTTANLFVLQCGDPSGTGSGGPAYTYAQENLPEGEIPTYPEGTVALALPSDPTTQQPRVNSSNSQFFIVYKDTGIPAQYPVIGRISKGIDIVKKIAEAGAVGPDGKTATDGKPKNDVILQSVTVTAAP